MKSQYISCKIASPVFFFTALLLGGLFANSSFSALENRKTLQEIWDCETQTKLACVSPTTLQAVQKTHTLMVAGYFNELSRLGWPVGYFKSNLEAIRLDLQGSASFFGHASHKTVQQNVGLLYKKILALHKKFKKPLVLIAHSAAGAVTLSLMLQHPEFILGGIVDRVILIQAAIGGSPLVHAAKASQKFGWLHPLLGTGIDSLSPEQSQIDFEGIKTQFKDFLESHYPDPTERTLAFKWISDRIFYIRSAVSLHDRSATTRLILKLLDSDLDPMGPNDGILLTQHQRLSWIGRDLDEIFPLDHVDLTIDFSPSMGNVQKVNSASRRAFTRSLLESAHSSPEGSETELPWNEAVPSQ